jgi:hypothetical protein
MNSDQLLRIVEQFCRKSESEFGEITVTQIPDHKTMYVERLNDDGRVITMTEFKVDGFTYWAGFSTRSQTVFISLAT